jgi:Fic family protein
MNYNKNHLNYKPIFTKEEIKKLDKINETLSLEKFLANDNLIDKFGFDFVYTSAKIEGNTYTKAGALTLLDYGRTSGGKRYSEAKMLINLQKAFSFMIKHSLPISKFTLREIHQILSDELVDDIEKGRVRQRGVTIRGTNYLPLSDSIVLEQEMDRLFSIYETIENPYDKALYLHNNLAYLQYFIDVNKRTARLMMNVSLKSEGKMILVPQEEYIVTYVGSILEYYEQGTYALSKEFMLKSYQSVADFMS